MPPSAGAEPAASLESWLRPARVITTIIMVTASATAAAAASYVATTGSLARVSERSEETAAGLAAERRARESSMAQLRTDSEQQMREFRGAVDARLGALERAQAAAERQMAVLEERLRTLGTTLDRMDRRQEVLLDRLNVPRARSARDYPQ